MGVTLHSCDLTGCAFVNFMCWKCSKALPLTDYGLNRSNKNGHQNCCKTCHSSVKKTHALSLKESNKDHNCVESKCDDVKKPCKKCSMPHPLSTYAYNKTKKNSHSDICAYDTYVRDAKRRNLSFSLTPEDFWKLALDECILCGLIEKGRNGIDRWNNQKGYSIDNCVSMCTNCNFLKHNLSIKNLMQRIVKIVDHCSIDKLREFVDKGKEE